MQGPKDDCNTDEHIPSYLPKYPAKHTYSYTKKLKERHSNKNEIRYKRIEEHKAVQKSIGLISKSNDNVSNADNSMDTS